MKKLLVLLAAAMVALSASAQMTEAYPSHIMVYGTAEMEVEPDEIYLSIVINERDSKGRISVDQQQREMIAALKKLGINVAEQLEMVDLSSAFFKRNTALATASYRLKLGDAATVARAWQALDALGISQVSIEQLDHSEIETYRVKVRQEAIRSARQKAVELAEAIDQKVGKCFYIYDMSQDATPVMKNSLMMSRGVAESSFADQVAEEQLTFQTIKLSYRVQAKFVLE